MIASLLLLPITAALSALHGSDRVPKMVCVGIHVIAIFLLLHFTGQPLSTAALASVGCPAFYWWIGRSGSVARAELDCMEKPVIRNYRITALAYLPYLAVVVGATIVSASSIWHALACVASVVLPLLSLRIFNYDTKIGGKLRDKELLDYEAKLKLYKSTHNFVPEEYPIRKIFWGCRRPTELASGIVGGFGTLAIIDALQVVAKAWGA